jgi:hypothetical protein
MKRFIYGIGTNYQINTLNDFDLCFIKSTSQAYRFGTDDFNRAYLMKCLYGLFCTNNGTEIAALWFSRYTWFGR